jgi:hypothetical protein
MRAVFFCPIRITDSIVIVVAMGVSHAKVARLCVRPRTAVTDTFALPSVDRAVVS